MKELIRARLKLIFISVKKGRVKFPNCLVEGRKFSLPFSFFIAEVKDICPPSGSEEVIIML